MRIKTKINREVLADLINKNYRATDIIKHLGIPKSTFYRVKQQLKEQGLITE